METEQVAEEGETQGTVSNGSFESRDVEVDPSTIEPVVAMETTDETVTKETTDEAVASTDQVVEPATTSTNTVIKQPPASSGFTKCPVYCRSNCIAQHHPLLVAVLNCVDTEHIQLMEMKLGVLYNVIQKYKKSHKWCTNEPIPDVLAEYRMPLLHWVCTLGRVGAAIWLVGHNVSDPETRSMLHDGETALHRALKCLQETCPQEASRKFVQLLSVLSPAMSIPDNDGNTPFHLCCEMLRTGLHGEVYYKECLHYMMYELNGSKDTNVSKVASVLNIRNCNGDTVLHLLAESSKNMTEIKPLVQLGADYSIENKAGATPFEICVRHACMPIQTFLEQWEKSDPQPPSFVLPGARKHEDKEVKTEDSKDSMETDESSDANSPQSDRVSSFTPVPPPPPPVVFPDDPELQNYFLYVIKRRDDIFKNHRVIKKEWSYSSFLTLLKALEEKNDAVSHKDIETMLKQIEVEALVEHLAKYRVNGGNHKILAEFIAKSRSESVTEMEKLTLCVEASERVFKAEQTKQEKVVTDVMSYFSNLSKLNREQDAMTKDMNEMNNNSRMAWQANCKLREKLINIESTLMVLKRLYYEEVAAEKAET